MAHFPFNGYIKLGTTDQSAHCFQMSANHTQAEIDDTVFGAPNFKGRIAGFQDLELSLQFREELAVGDLDEDIQALFGVGVSFAVAYRYKQGAISTSNPEYQFTAIITNEGAGGAVGDGAQKAVTVKIASGSLTRDVTP